MSNERKRAQPDCIKFFHSLPTVWVKKNIDGTSCPHCHRPVLPTTDTGAADYSGVLNRIGFVVEVKADKERIPFSSMSDEQYEWLENWQEQTGCMAWVWLLLGTAERVNQKQAEYPLSTYLLSFDTWVDTRTMLTDLGVLNLPLNALAAETRVVTRNQKLYAENILSDWRCAWQNGLWIPQKNHYFWSYYDLNPTCE